MSSTPTNDELYTMIRGLVAEVTDLKSQLAALVTEDIQRAIDGPAGNYAAPLTAQKLEAQKLIDMQKYHEAMRLQQQARLMGYPSPEHDDLASLKRKLGLIE